MVRIDVDKNPNWVDISLDKDTKHEIYRGNVFIGELVLQEPIKQKSVVDIIESTCNYLIPSYQRGYRWEKKQVEQLLYDIWDWGETHQLDRYSLQPIVIKESERGTEIVDGQQRLTTLFLILKAVGKQPNYSLFYETRSGSSAFLEDIEKHLEQQNSNIDYFYFVNTFKLARQFFEIHNSEKWYQYLTDLNTGAFFIEYNTSRDSRNVEQIFTSLNAGKIELTNAELVKGLFLKKNNFRERYFNELIEISQEWDRIERRLQEKNFWAWLGQLPTDEPRIEFVLNIVAKEVDTGSTNDSYIVFQEYLNKNNQQINKLWVEVKQCFMTLEDWYDDQEIYHYLGYLNINNSENDIQKYYHNYRIDDNFSFKNEVKNEKSFSNFDIEILDFEKNKIQIIDWLLLFNILTCIKDRVRFKFSEYQETKYDVEHIYPHSEFEKIDNYSERKNWFNSIKESNLFNEILDGVEHENEIISDKEKFSLFYQEVITYGGQPVIKNVNRIGNLCLLDSRTNRGYGNKPFPYKVKTITEVDANYNEYILPTTKNVFLKYYSGLNINNYIWSENDALKYETEIFNKIDEFMRDENE